MAAPENNPNESGQAAGNDGQGNKQMNPDAPKAEQPKLKVTFKNVIKKVIYTDDWEVTVKHCHLGNEEDQKKRWLPCRNS